MCGSGLEPGLNKPDVKDLKTNWENLNIDKVLSYIKELLTLKGKWCHFWLCRKMFLNKLKYSEVFKHIYRLVNI